MSLALTGMAAALLVAALGTARSVAARTEAVAAGSDSVAAAQELLRGRIERLLPDTNAAAGQPRTETIGEADRLTFVAPAPAREAAAGMVRYRLALQPDSTLDLAWTEVDGTLPRWRPQPLIGHVAALQLAYLGPAAAGGAPVWQAGWKDRADPPQLVRVRLRFADPDPRRWPDLLVRPGATISTSCEIDRTTGACRAS